MSPQEIFASFPESVGVLADVRDQNRETYKATLGVLAQRRKLRPAFLEKKPVHERHAWMLRELGRPTNRDIATEILQAWLVGSRRDLLVTFLDSLSVPHNGEGLIETLPDEPGVDELRGTIDLLLGRWPAWEVAAYLNTFCLMDIAQWPTLKGLVSELPALQPPALRQPAQ